MPPIASTGRPKPPLIEQLRDKYEAIKRLEAELRSTTDSRLKTHIMVALPQRRDEFNRLAMEAMPLLLEALDALTKPRAA